jgi:hypothetical protein
LIQHYWVLAKLLLTVIATVVLLLKMRLIGHLAAAAAETTLATADLHQTRLELVVHAGGGLLVLLVITTLSVFKPWGKTRFWKRHDPLQTPGAKPMSTTDKRSNPDGAISTRKILFAFIGVIVVGFIILHLASGGLSHRGH